MFFILNRIISSKTLCILGGCFPTHTFAHQENKKSCEYHDDDDDNDVYMFVIIYFFTLK